MVHWWCMLRSCSTTLMLCKVVWLLREQKHEVRRISEMIRSTATFGLYMEPQGGFRREICLSGFLLKDICVLSWLVRAVPLKSRRGKVQDQNLPMSIHCVWSRQWYLVSDTEIDTNLLHIRFWQFVNNFLMMILSFCHSLSVRFLMEDCNLVKWASWPPTLLNLLTD